MKIKPFVAVRPPMEYAAQVASPPYDVVDRDEARQHIADHPFSFLRIVRSDAEFPDTVAPYDPAVYQQASDNYARYQRDGRLVKAPTPALYVYRIQLGTHAQHGLVTVCHVDDYDAGRIKRHEKTRKPTEDDRTRHVDTLNANTGPVFLTYRDDARVDALVAEALTKAPLFDFESGDGARHTVWEMVELSDGWVEAFAAIPVAYVADGHHRAASAARVARMRRDCQPGGTGDEEYHWFLAVLFPASQLKVLAYNRCVHDLNGHTPDSFLCALRDTVTVTKTTASVPDQPGSVSMFLDGQWYALQMPVPTDTSPVAGLDVELLQQHVLSPLLDIDDPRNNSRIEFVGGVRGTRTLEDRVHRGRAAVAFSLYPVSVEQLMAVADADLIMPPKSTWFEPKLKSGLLIHELSDPA